MRNRALFEDVAVAASLRKTDFLQLVIENLPQSTTVSKVKDVSEGKDVEKKVKTVSFNPSVQVHDCETARSQTDVDIGSVAANGRLIEKVDNTAVDLSKRKRWAKDEWKKTMEKLRERKNEKENIQHRQQPQKAVQPSKVAFGRTTRLRPSFAASVGKRVHKIPALRVTVNVPEKHFRRTVYEPLAMMRIGENMEGLDSRKKQWSIRDFELRELLGEGKFGRVYLANKLNSKIPVALKVIEKKQIEESGFRHLVMREILIQSNLKHPNVLRLYNWFEDEQQICLVLENADGGELYKELKRNGHFSEREAATYIASVTNGLAHCHSRDVIHRDIKPENLLLKSDGQVKISDFGLSVMSKDKRWSVVGTLDYQAPEVLECKAHDCAVDNWAVGVLCYELLYGAPPFETESLYDTKRRIMDVDFSFPSTPTVSADAKNLISQLLVKDSSKRLTLRQVQKHPWIINNALF